MIFLFSPLEYETTRTSRVARVLAICYDDYE